MQMIKIENLHKSYGTQKILDRITMDVSRGEVVVIIGASGSRKSTFLRCINKLEPCQDGTITVDNIEVTSSSTNINKFRQKVGMVFQSFNLFSHLTVLRNVTLALTELHKMDKKSAEKIALDQLKLVKMEGQANSYPGQLSGGEQQRVAIARALA